MTTCLLCETSGLPAPFILMQRPNESLQLGVLWDRQTDHTLSRHFTVASQT